MKVFKMIQSDFNDNDRLRKRFYLYYTGLFLIISMFVFSWYFLLKRTLVWWGDGWQQHLTAMIYYGRYLRSIVFSLLTEHKLVIPEWDFYISEGSDIVTALHYMWQGTRWHCSACLFRQNICIYFIHSCAFFDCILRGPLFPRCVLASERRTATAFLPERYLMRSVTGRSLMRPDIPIF